MSYASFWKRTAAYLVDYFICYIITFVSCFIVGLFMGMSGIANDVSASLVGMILGFIISILYFVWPESSSWQATLGKKIFGLKVTDLNGERISFWRALGRYLGMIVSSLILCIGYLMCFWTEKRQCLHDKMAGCLVVDNTPNEKQGCVIAVIVVWILLFIFSIGLLTAIALPQYNRAVERSRMAQAAMALDNLATAQSVYYLQRNTFASSLNQLTLDNFPISSAGNAWKAVTFNPATGNAGITTTTMTLERADGTYAGAQLAVTMNQDENIKKTCRSNGAPAEFCATANLMGFEGN